MMISDDNERTKNMVLITGIAVGLLLGWMIFSKQSIEDIKFEAVIDGKKRELKYDKTITEKWSSTAAYTYVVLTEDK